MKQLLIKYLIAALCFGVSMTLYADIPTWVKPGSYPYGQGAGGLNENTFACWFQTTGDNIPVQIIWTNFIVDDQAASQFFVPYPGAFHITFHGKITNKAYYTGAYIMNQDYAGSYAKSLLGLSGCTWVKD